MSTLHAAPHAIIGRNIRPGFTPGGFIGNPSSKTGANRRALRKSTSTESIREVAQRWLNKRDIPVRTNPHQIERSKRSLPK